MTEITPTKAIIQRWPTRQDLADDAGVDLFAVHRWFQRNSIPGKHDARLLAGARRRGVKVTAKELIEARSWHGERNGHAAPARQGSAQ